MIFSFSHPQYLFLLFVVPVFFLIHFFSLTNRKKRALNFANFDAIARISGIDFFSKNLVLLFFEVLIVVFIVFALSGLTLHTTMETSSFSFVIAVDASKSMSADDFSPNRINVAKNTAASFIDSAPFGVKLGVISFAGSSRIETDLTSRKDEAKDALYGIALREFGGTDVYEAVLTGGNLLKNEEHKAIILLSDGQINVGSIDDAVEYANDNDVLIHTIGMGTEEGGKTEFGFSKLDEDSLKSLAYNTGGVYAHAGNKENLSQSFLNLLSLTERKVSIPLADYLLLAVLVLIVLGFFLKNTKYISFP